VRYLSLLLLFTTALCAEMPHLAGVWKADLQKSKFSGPPPTGYLVIIEQKSDVVDRRTKETAPEFVETAGITAQHGEERANFTAFDYAKPVVRLYDGIPTRLTGTSSGNAFTVVGEVAGTPDHFKRTYTLSPGGQSLTLAIEGASGGHPIDTTIALHKVPEADGEPLRKPEEIASVRFKNVKVDALKNLPASEFISQMHYFSWSLGKPCTFCHVEHKFDSDDKKEKKTARKMVDMAVAINEHNFEGHPNVRCFTCHEGHQHPPTRPMFADEIAAAQDEHDHADHEHH
jgi:hypothetical protein